LLPLSEIQFAHQRYFMSSTLPIFDPK
jgi:hypothetical protein